MTLLVSTATANGLANGSGLKEQFDGGLLYLFAGPVPATADEALDMVSAHTEAVVVSVNSAGTGLTFDAPNAGVLGKAAAEVWSGVVATEGANGAATSITPTFYRFCAAGDNGRGAADAALGYRVQGAVGGPNSGAELQLGAAELVEGNTQPVGSFGWKVG